MQKLEFFESLNLQAQTKLAELVAVNALPSIVGMPGSSGNLDGAQTISRTGGMPDLSCEYPRDRAGRPLLFLGQINFADLWSIYADSSKDLARAANDAEFAESVSCQSFEYPKTGLLSIFWNERKDSSNPKDRHSFRIIWSDSWQPGSSNLDPAIKPICDAHPLSFTNHWSLPPNASDWIGLSDSATESAGSQIASKNVDAVVNQSQVQSLIEQNTKSLGDALCIVFGHGDAEINRKKEIAAFASNGVSWSPARSADSCYSHLVDASRDWIFLLRMNSMPRLGFDLGSTKSISLLIHKDDLKENRLDKAWMVF